MIQYKKLFNAVLLATAVLAAPAYAVTALESTRTVGNQDWIGNLGTDFTVNSTISVTSLGAFDSEQNGIVDGVSVGIYNLSGVLQGTSVFIDSTDTLIGQSRYESVAFNLAPGNYSIVAVGFNSNDKNGNTGIGAAPGGTAAGPTLNTGGGLISFTSNIRWDSSTSLALPTSNTLAVPSDRFDAGTFTFTSAVPEPGEWAMMLSGLAAVGLIAKRRRKLGA